LPEKQHYQLDDQTFLTVNGSLEPLLKRLKKGMRLNGRIIEKLADKLFILRIWGYNIVMDSQYDFRKFEEICLMVKQIEPEFKLELLPRLDDEQHPYHHALKKAMNIIVY